MRAETLKKAFERLRPLLAHLSNPAPRQFICIEEIRAALSRLREPLASAKERGLGINPWSIAGLKRNEVRNAAVLAGLWSDEFGGKVSRNFLANYLTTALPRFDWDSELAKGYRVSLEKCPTGDRSERIDLVVEASAHIVGIEIKIDAGLRQFQLERYLKSITERGRLTKSEAHVVLLSSLKSHLPDVPETSWGDVAKAADKAVSGNPNRSFVDHYIASFAMHVREF